MLAGDDRHPGGRGAGGRPPRAEHVAVHEIGARDALGEPLGERLARLPLQVADLREVLDLEAVRPREVEARGRRVPRDDRGLDPVLAERAAET